MKTFLLAGVLLFCSSAWGAVAGVSGACTAQNAVASGALLTATLTCTPNAANHALIIVADCSTSGASQTSVTIAASPSSGWSFFQTTTFTGTTSATNWAQSWGAIIPNTSSTTFTVTWQTNCGFSSLYAQEFSGNDTTGSATTFYASNQSTSTTGGCSGAAVTSTSSSDGVFAFCNDSLPTTSWQGAGWTQGVDDANGDGSEYKIATGSQTPAWGSTSGAFNNGTVTVKAAGTAAPTRPPVVY